jgi:hypothetical protein
MKGAKAFVACLVLALLAGSASASVYGRQCKIKKKWATSCSYYSDALGMQLELTQACVSSYEALDSTNKYYVPGQPWFGKSKATIKTFIQEVGNSCNFGQPNTVGVNRSPLACYGVHAKVCTGSSDNYYDCYGVTKFNNDKKGTTGCCGTKKCKALLSALN